MLQGPAQPAADGAGRAAGTDGAAVAFEPHLTGRITEQVLAVIVGQCRSEMQGCDRFLDIDMHHHGGVLPVRAGRHLGVPAGLDADS